MGVGILTSSTSATHGAGPSGHSTAARILTTTTMAGPSNMDVDTPEPPENGTVTVAAPPPAEDNAMATEPPTS